MRTVYHAVLAIVFCLCLAGCVDEEVIDEWRRQSAEVKAAAVALNATADDLAASLAEAEAHAATQPDSAQAVALVAAIRTELEATKAKRDHAVAIVSGIDAQIQAAESGWDLLDLGLALGAGIPGLGGFIGLARWGIQNRNAFQTLVQNLDDARDDGEEEHDAGVIVVNHDRLKNANVAAGIQGKVAKARGRRR